MIAKIIIILELQTLYLGQPNFEEEALINGYTLGASLIDSKFEPKQEQVVQE